MHARGELFSWTNVYGTIVIICNLKITNSTSLRTKSGKSKVSKDASFLQSDWQVSSHYCID